LLVSQPFFFLFSKKRINKKKKKEEKEKIMDAIGLLLWTWLIAFFFFGFAFAYEYDHRFSGDSCIVVGLPIPYLPCMSPEFNNNRRSEPSTHLDEETFNYQIYYSSIEDALEDCPFTPVLIEITGYHYIQSLRRMKYEKTASLIIKGVGDTLVANFAHLHIVHSGVNVHLEGWKADGCGTSDNGIFYAEREMDTCKDEKRASCSNVIIDVACLVRGILMVHNMHFTDYRADHTLCHGGGDTTITNSNFTNIPISAIRIYDSSKYVVAHNYICPCGYDSRAIGKNCMDVTENGHTPHNHIKRNTYCK
jgi:hypothetical protein